MDAWIDGQIDTYQSQGDMFINMHTLIFVETETERQRERERERERETEREREGQRERGIERFLLRTIT